MHCKTIGHATNIVDLESDRLRSAPGKKLQVYGKDYAHDFAWLYVVDDPRTYDTKSLVNPMTALNGTIHSLHHNA